MKIERGRERRRREMDQQIPNTYENELTLRKLCETTNGRRKKNFTFPNENVVVFIFVELFNIICLNLSIMLEMFLFHLCQCIFVCI